VINCLTRRYTTKQTARSRALFQRTFFAERAGAGSPARDPIFIVGLPRSGSTRLNRFWPATRRLKEPWSFRTFPAIVSQLGLGKATDDSAAYPEMLAALSSDELRALGEEYLQRTRIRRITERPLFIDQAAEQLDACRLIQLMLPNATIIDARRHPMACCFSGFKQHFARGQGFTYDLADIGRYYRGLCNVDGPFRRSFAGQSPPGHI